jgi:Tfp pilus assembly protein PilF
MKTWFFPPAGYTLMKFLRLVFVVFLGLGFAWANAEAQTPPEKKKEEKKAPAAKKGERLPHTKLAPAKLVPGLSLIKYRVSTSSPECQAYFDQGLGYFYSYVWMEAARSFETALKYDPDCAMAWLGLSRACEEWKKAPSLPPLKKAQELLPRASHREGLLIKARLQEKGQLPEQAKGEAGKSDTEIKVLRRKEAAKTIDELLTLFEDDEEGWFYRAKLSEGNGAVPYYKALLRLNPEHSGAHHELIHHYEGIRRPALGWAHAEGFVRSSPGIPHALHMQAHLATRIGRFDKTTDRSARAIELEEAYHKLQNVKPGDDHQFSHHLNTLMHGLVHDGRFKEADALKKKCQGYKIENRLDWFGLHVAEHAWDEALKIAEQFKKDKLTASYLRAVVYLRKGDYERAVPEVNVLREAYQTKRTEKNLEARLWETEGMLLCGQGGADGGLKLLARAADKSKDNYGQHAWGHGAYYMEAWGLAALRAQRLVEAEEAFLEALAHDTSSVRGALGMQVVCERQGRSEEAARFAELAQRCWRRADAGAIEAELNFLRGATTTASGTPR